MGNRRALGENLRHWVLDIEVRIDMSEQKEARSHLAWVYLSPEMEKLFSRDSKWELKTVARFRLGRKVEIRQIKVDRDLVM